MVRPTDRPLAVNQTTTLHVTSETRTQRTFTKTVQGRRYDNGMMLRPAATVRVNWQKPYFPRGHAYYPY